MLNIQMTDNLRMEHNTSVQVKWSTKEAWNSGISEFQASLVYKVSSKKAKATKRKSVLKKQNSSNKEIFFSYMVHVSSCNISSHNFL